MNRKQCSILMLIIVLILICCACGKTQPADNSPELVLTLPLSGSTDALPEINTALNDYLLSTVGFRVQIKPFTNADTLLMELTSGNQIDVAYCPSLDNMHALQKEGLLIPLDDYLRSSDSTVLSLFPLEFYNASNIGGFLYGLPTNREWVRTSGFEYNRDIANTYGLDFSKVHTLDDLTGIFSELSAKTDEIAPIAVLPGFLYYDHVDTLGDSLGVLTQSSGTQVVNLYETGQFSEMTQAIRAWQLAGYTFDDPGENEVPLYYLRSNQVLGCLTIGKPGFEVQEKTLSGLNIGYVSLSDGYYYSSDISLRPWYVIPTTAKDPTLSAKLMEVLYADPYVANLIMYGLEGVHYTLTQEQLVSRIENSGYDGVIAWVYCNSFIGHVPVGLDTNFWEEMQLENRNALNAPYFGFVFDSTPVSTQLYRCEQVREEYLNLLYSGVCDPEPLLDKMNAALKEAGIDEIIAEKQRQLDAYMEKR